MMCEDLRVILDNLELGNVIVALKVSTGAVVCLVIVGGHVDVEFVPRH